jgi:predicted dehydrogenase
MARKQLRVGLVGHGFMARTHSNAYKSVSQFFDLEYEPVLQAVCGRHRDDAEAFAQQWGYASVETDWKTLVGRDDIDLIDICAPNHLHARIAIAAAEAGKIVLTEKPLARNTAEARPMVEAVEKAGVANLVWYNYRRIPAVTYLRNIVASGALGRIFHYRANFLQDWTISQDVTQGGGNWRLDSAVAGSGVTGDLLAHCLDTALWINGSISSVTAATETFIKERKSEDTGKSESVTIDDAVEAIARFGNGSLGLFESTRYARGHKAAYTLEINGAEASLAWDLDDLNHLLWFDHRVDGPLRGWSRISVTDAEHPYLSHWWVPGLGLGYEHSFIHTLADFLEGLSAGEQVGPTFRDALETTQVCDAILKSAATGQWESPSES